MWLEKSLTSTEQGDNSIQNGRYNVSKGLRIIFSSPVFIFFFNSGKQPNKETSSLALSLLIKTLN